MKGETRIFMRSWLVCISLFLCLSFFIDAIGQTGNSLCQPSGIVKYKGTPVPDDCVVKALIQGTVYAQTKVVDGSYSLSIPADDPSTSGKEGWVENEYVTLKVEGYSGGTLFQAKSGNVPVDINLTTMGVLNLTTWGKIKALFK
jgi:hypothetical protein